MDESVVQYIPKDSDIEMNPDKGEVALFHTVIYIVDGQKENVFAKDNTQTLEKDVKVKEGYTFIGWYNGEKPNNPKKPEGPSKESEDVATKPNDTPKTGENSLIVLYGLLLTSSAMLVKILEKKKRLMK